MKLTQSLFVAVILVVIQRSWPFIHLPLDHAQYLVKSTFIKNFTDYSRRCLGNITFFDRYFTREW